MSIILKGSINSSSGSNKAGLAVDNIDLQVIDMGLGKVDIKWNDPDDKIIDGVIIAKWKGTIIVYKEGSIPESTKDGILLINNTTRNKYSENPIKISLTINKTYYFRSFTYTTDGIYNMNKDNCYKRIINDFNANSILSNNTWDKINEVCLANKAQTIWNIGDEITYTFDQKMSIWAYRTSSGSDIRVDIPEGTVITFQIYDFDHYTLSDGKGKANITFGCKNLLNFNGSWVDTWPEGGYPTSNLYRQASMSTIRYRITNTIPNIKTVKIPYTSSDGYDKVTIGTTPYTDTVFPPSATEVGWEPNPLFGYPKEGFKFPLFTDDKSRKKISTDGNSIAWMTRTVYSRSSAWYVKADGTFTTHSKSSPVGSICFCFCI